MSDGGKEAASPKSPTPAGPSGQVATASASPTAATPSSSSSPIKMKRQKRRRTRSTNSSSPSASPGRGFFIPGFNNLQPEGASQAKMSLRDVMDAAKGLTNMYLAHEIAVDKDFMLQDLKPKEEAASLETEVKKIVHKAFWDLLEEQLKEDPPNFQQAISLLTEIKEGILGLLVPQQKRLIESINGKLDVELVSQQAENGVLDFQDYATYVINVLAQLCAPVRDEEIAALRAMSSDVVPLFQGIMKTLDHMKLDMANFHIQQARPLIVDQSVDYEKKKFKEFLAIQDDGLQLTRSWLKRHAPPDEELAAADAAAPSDSARFLRLRVQRVLNDAFLELLEWDDDQNPFPETLVMDSKRILALRDATERTTVSTAVILLTFSNVQGFIVPMDAQKLKETMKKNIDILLEEFETDDDLLKILPSVSAQVVKDVNEHLTERSKPQLPESAAKNLEEQIAEMENPNHRIRDLVQRRIVDFAKQAISASRSAPLQVPPGLTLCQRELAQIAGNFVRLINYNRAVFGEFYLEIIENHVLFKRDNEKSEC